MGCKIVGYNRVSRESQGADWIRMASQKTAVAAHVATNGCDLIGEYTEVETGKKRTLDNRPALRKAVPHAKRSRAFLVVAKLDRLLRLTVVRSMLKTSGVRFVACDYPHANELTVDILAAVAEDEVRRISARTTAALQALKSRGVVLGSHRPEYASNLPVTAARQGREIGARRDNELVNEAYTDIADMMLEMQRGGSTPADIAATLY